VNLYVKSPVLMDLHGVPQSSNQILDYLDLKFHMGQYNVLGLRIEIPTVDA
jgi:hypothetical protein